MTAPDGQDELENQFVQWRQYVQRRRELQKSDAEELEDHLRSSVDELVAVGLRADEAFLVAVKRMGSLDDLSREFALEHSERLWKQLVLTGETDGPVADTRSRRDLVAMVICAAGAAASIKVPELFGMSFEEDGAFYGLNFGLFALPWLAAFLAWRRQARPTLIGVLLALFALGAVAANAYPLADDSQSVVLTGIHLPIALWFVVGLAYVADDLRSSRRRMDFIRFTGEWFVYFVLIALGGGVLIAFMFGTFEAIGISPEDFISQWLLPCGVVSAVVVAGWLVEAKQSVVENIAPVLTRLFTPLFTAVLLAFLVAVGWTSAGTHCSWRSSAGRPATSRCTPHGPGSWSWSFLRCSATSDRPDPDQITPVATAEPPRVSWRLRTLQRWESCQHRGRTRMRSRTGRSGWCSRSGGSPGSARARWPRWRRGGGSTGRRCGAGYGRPRSTRVSAQECPLWMRSGWPSWSERCGN